MQSNIKSSIPSFACLLLGMIIFFSSSVFPFPPTSRLAFGIFLSVILFLMSSGFLRYEKISLSAVHLKPNNQSISRFIQGLLIGGAIVGVMLVVLFSLTDLNLERVQDQSWLAFLLASSAIIPLALMEEILFRGYPFFRLTQMMNVRWVILITALLFALYHFNGSQNIGVLFLGPGIWGVVFAIAAYFSKSIAVPLGIHVAANLLQSIFGLKTHYTSMWTISKTSVPTMGIVDPEVLGIIMQVILLIASIAFLEWLIRRQGVEKRLIQE